MGSFLTHQQRLVNNILQRRSSLCLLRSTISKNNNNKSLRFMGGGGVEPPEANSMKAELFGDDLEKNDTGWKLITQFTYAAALFICGLGFFAPDTSIQTWASQEARARLKLRDKGVKLQFGTHYGNEDSHEYDFEAWEKFDVSSLKFEDDDDDDDDEDDEDDEDDDDEDDEEDDDDDDDDE